MSLSALNTVFDYHQDLSEQEKLTFVLDAKFRNLVEPIFGILTEQNKLRTTMIPVKNSMAAIKVSKKPELFGTLTAITKSGFSYPKLITPSTKGNPTVQAIVYVGESINSNALTLANMSITTDENPLVLKLMSNKINVSQTWDGVDIYPNPTTNFLTIDINNIVDEPKKLL
ncbi:MAG: hypothetical protein IPG79_12695 [Saprospiraceae bacterium]|nr:hypothetical protein [Saprospiraceae bacterium]